LTAPQLAAHRLLVQATMTIMTFLNPHPHHGRQSTPARPQVKHRVATVLRHQRLATMRCQCQLTPMQMTTRLVIKVATVLQQ